jgi:hypothetical protein
VTILQTRLQIRSQHIVQIAWALAVGGVVLVLAPKQGWWWLALAIVTGIELLAAWGRRQIVSQLMIPVVMAACVVLAMTLVPRLASQISLALVYIVWRWWWSTGEAGRANLPNLLVLQTMISLAVFLMAVVWRVPSWFAELLMWGLSYTTVLTVMSTRREQSARLLAASWALIVTQLTWLLQIWLFTYTVQGGYVMIPQGVLVITAMGYCFGSIYMSARAGSLSRGRLMEFLAIGIVIIIMVVSGTSWKGAI